jgi:hypothetical protein
MNGICRTVSAAMKTFDTSVDPAEGVDAEHTVLLKDSVVVARAVDTRRKG